jgi:hypothetical protein
MNPISFVETFLHNMHHIREEEFHLYHYTYEKKKVEKKMIQENSMEFKNYSNKLKKKALQDKNKPGQNGKREYESSNLMIDILEDDIFHNLSEEQSDTDVKINIDTLDNDQKTDLIYDFLQRKNIIFDPEQLIQLKTIIEDPTVSLKKYIHISKMYQQITRISFIKKMENQSYIIDFQENKTRKGKNHFFK